MSKSLTDSIVEREWRMFDKVVNAGGRASCQDNYPEFKVMRSSQFDAWDYPSSRSYFEDLVNAEKQGRNLLAEKYAYMSGHEYLGSPQEGKDKAPLVAAITERLVNETEVLRRSYPAIAENGRPLRKADACAFGTSVEEYFMGELMTYSITTLQLLWNWIDELSGAGRSLSEEIMRNTVKMKGFQDLEHAEDALQARRRARSQYFEDD